MNWNGEYNRDGVWRTGEEKRVLFDEVVAILLILVRLDLKDAKIERVLVGGKSTPLRTIEVDI